MSYAAEHADALDDLRGAGAEVTFRKVTQTHDPATETFTESVASVSGYAVRTRAISQQDRQRYEALGLVSSDVIVLLFTTYTYGDAPELGSTCTWGGATNTYMVRDVDALDPDGSGGILFRVAVSK
jgi:hypothetical protein